MALLTLCALAATLLPEHRDTSPAAVSTATAPAQARRATQTSAQCLACHAETHARWASSHHALAHRTTNAATDQSAFSAPSTPAGFSWNASGPLVPVPRTDGTTQIAPARYAIGHTPLRQYVVDTGGGRLQATEHAFDPARGDWFSVFPGEDRRPGEWGHWTGRGMNWNSMCAHCHVTDYRKNYDPATDTYASTWSEPGIGCIQCHGEVSAEHLRSGWQAPALTAEALATRERRAMETCAPCHARNELLTGRLAPGADYSDHYRLELPVQPGVFYADGQVRDEDYNYTSLLLSRMGGHAGVTCLDCHDSHTAKPRLPAENNQLCLQCHAAPGRTLPSGARAVPIDPVAHSHHANTSTGNRCVSCHMPTTTYMGRDPRHDHGFLHPDPLLTRELGIPNACNRCHTDRSTDWAIQQSETWYGARLEHRQRHRARAIHAAQTGHPDAAAPLLTLLASEDVPAWRATYLQLLAPYAPVDGVAPAARSALADREPLVRSAAISVLTNLPEERSRLVAQLTDPSRLVRLDAALALGGELPPASPVNAELSAYFTAGADQPSGLLRIAQHALNRNQAAAAEPLLRRAEAWDPASPAASRLLGYALDALNRPADAAVALNRAARLAPADALVAFEAGLAFATAKRLADAEAMFREALRRDASLDRAWYNLGLLQAGAERLDEARTSLGRAETLRPNMADYPYALATVLWRQGDRSAAQAAARRTLQLAPNHAGAQRLLRQP